MIVIIFGMIMGLTHYFSEFIELKKYCNELVSISAGISLTYIFLRLFPEFSKGASQESQFLFLSIIIGFTLLHVIENHIYKHTSRYERFKELMIEDSIISFLYHFVIGMMMVSFFSRGLSHGILFFIPVILYTAVSTLPVDRTTSNTIKIIVAFSTLLGILFSLFIYKQMSQIVYLTLLGLIIGILSFTVTRHLIPKGKKGKPLFFLIGVIAYSALIFLL